MSPLRRHIFVCFYGKMGVFGPSSVKRGRTQIVFGWNISGASSSTYPENLWSGGQLPAELRGRVCLFSSVFFVRHATLIGTESPDGAYTYWTWGNGHKAPDSFSYRSNFRFRSRSRSSSCSTTSGDIFYCSGSRQLNHSSSSCCCFVVIRFSISLGFVNTQPSVYNFAEIFATTSLMHLRSRNFKLSPS